MRSEVRPSNQASLELAARLKHVFRTHFSGLGYIEKPSLPVASGIDRTVHFVGSVSNVLKNEFLSKHQLDRSFIVQDCFRTQSASRILDPGYDARWGSNFTMMGGSAETWQGEALFYGICALLETYVQGTSARLLVYNEEILCRLLGGQNRVLKGRVSYLDPSPEEYQQDWIYGERNIRGVGLTFFIHNGEERYEIGNLIKLYRDEKEIGYEFGFGVEAIVMGLLRLNFSLLARPIGGLLAINNANRRKLADAVESSLQMIDWGITTGSRDKPRLLRQYIKAVEQYARLENLGLLYLDALAEKFCSLQAIEPASIDLFLNYVHVERLSHELEK
jgi:hypothetical protein